MGFLNIFKTGKNKPSIVKDVDETLSEQQTKDQCLKIISAYGNAVERLNLLQLTIVIDEKKLPFPKHDIKVALLSGLGMSDNPQWIAAAKASYLYLAHWQQGVGDEDIIEPDLSKMDIPNEGDPDFESKVNSLAAKICEGSDIRQKWQDIVFLEMNLLQQELDGWDLSK